MEAIKNQIAEKQSERLALSNKERAEHLRDLKLQDQMFQRREKGLAEHKQSIVERDNMINNHFIVSKIAA